MQYEEPTRDAALWSGSSMGSSWGVQTPRDLDVWPPLSPAEQKTSIKSQNTNRKQPNRPGIKKPGTTIGKRTETKTTANKKDDKKNIKREDKVCYILLKQF